jgi:hypothetical protein
MGVGMCIGMGTPCCHKAARVVAAGGVGVVVGVWLLGVWDFVLGGCGGVWA